MDKILLAVLKLPNYSCMYQKIFISGFKGAYKTKLYFIKAFCFTALLPFGLLFKEQSRYVCVFLMK